LSFLPKFELVYWADLVYDDPYNPSMADRENLLFLEEPYLAGTEEKSAPQDDSLRRRVLEFVEEQLDRLLLNADLSINYSRLSDRIMYHYFRDLELYYGNNFVNSQGQPIEVKKAIRERLANVLRKYKGYSIMLIGHSMGSIIAYDVLTFMMQDHRIDTLVTIGSPLGFPVLQGKIAEEWKRKQPEVHKLKTPPGIRKHWYNFADLRDKVALIWQLRKQFDANAHEVSPVDFAVQNDYSNGNEANPHKSYGYLRTEAFARVLSEFTGEPLAYQKIIGRVAGFFRNVKNGLKKRAPFKAP